jgi:hypothetical protein
MPRPKRNGGQLIDAATQAVAPLPPGRPIDLATVRDCRRFAARIVREMYSGSIPVALGNGLLFGTMSVAKMIESEQFEARLVALENGSGGYAAGELENAARPH